MSEVLVVGALHLDVIVSASRLPRQDETLMGDTVRYAFGGKGGNQAVAARRMGAGVAMAGRVGRDEFGDRLLADLAASGIDPSRVERVDRPSGMSVAILDPGGDYGAVVVSGANLELRPGQIALPDGLKVLVLQNEIPQPVNLDLARRARDLGVLVLLNAAPARRNDEELLRLVDWLVVNRVEAEDLAGPGTPGDQARRLRAMGATRVVITLGAGGELYSGPEAEFALPASAVTVVSTHGAGDMFCGALAAGLARDAPPAEALAFAGDAAALLVSSPPDARSRIDAAAVRAHRARAGA